MIDLDASALAAARKAIATTIHQVLSASMRRPECCVIDTMVYGRKFNRPEIFGIEWSYGSDAFGVTLPLDAHVCDMIVSLRFGDPRIGVFLPNSLVQVFDEPASDPLDLLVGGEPREQQRLPEVVAGGFGAYPSLGIGDYPNLLVRRHEHGVYVEYCFAGTLRDLVNKALMRKVHPSVAGDAMGHAAIHIMQSIAAHVRLADMRSKIMRGMVERLEFTHPCSSAELIRNYGLEPGILEVVREAAPNSPGEYVLNIGERDRERLALFLSEVVAASLQKAA